MEPSIEPFLPIEIATKLLVSLAIGLLIGFEREWAHKELGVRTFAVVSLFGMLAPLISAPFVLVAMAGIIAILAIVNIANISTHRMPETTTTVTLIVTFALGVLVGQGHIFTPTASAIVVTLLLSMKPQFSRFAGGLTQEEVKGAVLMGLIGFVIYPLLPNRFIDPWELLNPREAWFTVILIAAIGFVNYILLRVYSTRGLYYTAVFGGLVNSTAVIAQLSSTIAQSGPNARRLATVVNLLTISSMFVRNLALLLIFSEPAGLIAAIPIGLMALGSAALVWWHRKVPVDSAEIALGSPISLRQLTSFGVLFVFIQAASSLGERFFGQSGTVIVSFMGGLASSASSTAAVASLAEHGHATPGIAAVSTVAASIASTLVNLPIIYRETQDRDLVRDLFVISIAITITGLGALLILGAHR
ncbi:MgtC/SapB family protein [Bryobacter aggregatus]|uniref:MgtC/SapB family protein n=1 Tax=Bryobacter aggregatus TaxID=360054 RepID=UPI00068C9848|nr:DUF4010 domain-containing protein [Bryobacter aggregatus]